MRPINKGTWPTTPTKALEYVFNNWRRARPFLVERTGKYCHLCEMRVNNCLAVEHIKAKDHFPRLANHWDNFLLICTACNSRKLAEKLEVPYRQRYYWPHLNNTLMAFEVPLTGSKAALLIPRAGLTAAQQARALNTVNLYKLDQSQTNDGDADKRYLERMKAIKSAIDRRLEYLADQVTIKAIVDSAQWTGFPSAWLSVFDDIAEVREALLKSPDFKMDIAWFDAALNLLPRNPGSGIDPI